MKEIKMCLNCKHRALRSDGVLFCIEDLFSTKRVDRKNYCKKWEIGLLED